MANEMREGYGALVGWTTKRKGKRITLRMQSVQKPPPYARSDVHSQFYLLDENQAVQLGNQLFEITNQTKPRFSGRGLLARLFG